MLVLSAPHRRLLAPLLILGLVGCAASTGAAGGDGGAGGAGGAAGTGAVAAGGSGSGATGGSGAAGGAAGAGATGGSLSIDAGLGEGCSAAATFIYVVAKSQELHRFDPATLSVSPVGPLQCPGTGTATVFSMAVDRGGTAWVLYNDGQLFHVDVETAACAATGYVPGQSGFDTFGMGFVSDAPGSASETLYLASEFDLGRLDTSSLTVSTVGAFGFSAAAELTGTGDARLFGLFFGFPPYIAPLDRNTGALGAEQPLDTVEIGTGFAFAFWGGEFWVFTAPTASSSEVHRYSPVTRTATRVVDSVGFKVVGAGVSTCAPLEPPT